jgi:hypothetical protein
MLEILIPPSMNNPVERRGLEEVIESFRPTRIIIGEVRFDTVLEAWNARYPEALA